MSRFSGDCDGSGWDDGAVATASRRGGVAVRVASRLGATGRAGDERRRRADVGAAPRGPGALVAEAAWFGMVTGLLELALLVARRHLYSSAALGSLQLNRQFAWMIPTANLMMFGTLGIALGLLARLRPRPAARAADASFCFLATVTLLLAVQRLHPMACLVLALAVAARVGPRLSSRWRAFRRIIRPTLPVLAGAVLVLLGRTIDEVSLAESRAQAALPRPEPGAPNVLLIVLDTVRADHLSLSGYGRETTPNLARLANEGVRFERARSAAPCTLPSHASMFTGRWPHELFSRSHQPLGTAHPTLAEALRNRGYETAGFVANTYFCNSWYGLNRGFVHYEDHFDGDRLVSPSAILRCSELGKRLLRATGTGRSSEITAPRKDAARVNGEFLSWLSGRRPGRPFFAFLNYIDAHDPYLAPPWFHRHLGTKPEGPEDFETLANWYLAPKAKVSPRDLALARDAYDDCIAAIDEQIGRLFDALRERGLDRNTLVVVTADHGEGFGEHRLFSHAMSLYRPEIDVPLVIAGPSGIPRGRVVRETVSLRDLPATILDRAGARGGVSFPGRSLARFWDPAAPTDRRPDDPVLSVMSTYGKYVDPHSHVPALRGTMYALTTDRNVYIRNGNGVEELYDVATDPSESRDLAGDSRSRPLIEESRAALARILRDSPRAR